MADAAKPARPRTKKADASGGFSDDEKAAMKERARELKNAARRNPADERADGERDLQAKLAELDGPDRAPAGPSTLRDAQERAPQGDGTE